jgi:hypothetical protein
MMEKAMKRAILATLAAVFALSAVMVAASSADARPCGYYGCYAAAKLVRPCGYYGCY